MIGDSYGLPNEGLPPTAVKLTRRIPVPWRPTSDDSEHTFLVLDAINRSTSVEAFRRCLAWNLRWWSLSLPIAIGLATARSCFKLWLGADRGVYSAGNGPCMRVPAMVEHVPAAELTHYLEASTRLTHTDPKALWACQGLAYALLHSERGAHPQHLLAALAQISADPAWTSWLTSASEALAMNWTPSEFTSRLGSSQGVSGYALHTVPAVIYTWLWTKGAAVGLKEIVQLGGDTDSTGALMAALVSRTDPEGLSANYPAPQDWPVRQSTLRHLESGGRLTWTFFPSLFLRNLISLPLYISHALLRRLF